MPRNGSGVYVLPISFTAGTAIIAADMDSDLNDLGNALTGSLPRDGQAGMTGQFDATDGTLGAPGISWGTDPTTGIRRTGAGSMAMVCSGADVLTVTPAGVGVLGSVLMPVGVILDWPVNSTTPPNGWFFPDGTAKSRTLFPELFAALGTWYGIGDGSTTFNLPYEAGRVVVSPDNINGSAADNIQVSTTITTNGGNASATVGSIVGVTIGMFIISANVTAGTLVTDISGTTITMSLVAAGSGSGTACRFSFISDPQVIGAKGGSQSLTLVTQQLASHAHDVSATTGTASAFNHTHSYTDANTKAATAATGGGQTGLWQSTAGGTTGSGGVDHTHALSTTTTNTGGGGRHGNVQPTIVYNRILYAGRATQ